VHMQLMQHLHSLCQGGRGIVHRDLKLENLLLAAPNNISCVKIAGVQPRAASCSKMSICAGF